MTTVVTTISPALARDLAQTADRLGWTHADVAREAVRLFVRAEQDANRRGGGQL